MNNKNQKKSNINQSRLVRKLLSIGKKHKALVYPMLALVAVCSVCSYFYRWATSSGRRVVAAVLVGVLVLSQSYFMTSSAHGNDLVEEEEQLIDTSAMDDETEDTESQDLIDSSDTDGKQTQPTEADPSDTVGTSTAADLEDADDLRPSDDTQASGKDASPETKADTDSESQTPVSTDRYAGTNSGTITSWKLPSGTEKSRILPAGTSLADTKKLLPSVLTCSITTQSNLQVTQDLKVTWDSSDWANTNAKTTHFKPTLNDASNYITSGLNIDDVTITIDYLTKYTIKLNYTGTLTDVKFLTESGATGYYGYDGISYTLPGVDRAKADGSGNFTFAGWYDQNGQLVGGKGESMSRTNITSLELTARFSEAEVTYIDEKHTTVYDYPTKGTAYNVTKTPAQVTGYHFDGWSLAGRGIITSENPKVSDSIDDITLTAVWSPLQYTINYDSNYGTGSGYGTMNGETHTYDKAGEKIAECAYTRYGYRFAGWSEDSSATPDSPDLIAAGTAITNKMIDPLYQANGNVNMPQLQLYAVWELVRITFDDNTVSKTVNATYGTAMSEEFGVTNGKTTSGNFGVAFKSASMDGQSCTPSDYIDGFGITVQDQKLVISGTPVKVWTDMVITVTVEDITAGTSDDLNVTISANPKTLKIANITVPSKVYDGSNNLTPEGRAGVQVTLDGIYGQDDVAVDLDKLNIYYGSANVGDNGVTLGNVELTGAAKDYYIISDMTPQSESARITKRPLHVTLSGLITKYAGEKAADPSSMDFALAFADDETEETKQLVAGDGGFDRIMTITYDVPQVDEQKVYDIPVTIISDNYDVSCDASCKLEVTQDIAKLETGDASDKGNYLISGTYNEDTQWYTDKVTITPYLQHGADYYNQILLVGAQEWTSAIEIDDDSELNGKEIQVMMKNSRTGAYTTDSAKMTIHVDSQAPTLANKSFSPASKTSILENIGNFFTYGNFFKESVVATLTFEDNKSGCDTIYYSINGADWDQRSLDANGSCNITIPLGTNNQVLFYVTDKAGNSYGTQDAPVTLTGTEDGTDWVIENSDPQITGYYIANMEGDRISNLSSGGWYNQQVQVIAQVKESESGVRYSDWYVNGEVERVTENSLVRSDDDTTVAVSYPFTKSGVYDIGIEVGDNAKNTSGKADLTTVRIDLDAPEIHLDESQIPTDWSKEADIHFTVTDDVSGIYRVTVIPPTGASYELYPNDDDSYTLKATQEGVYTIVSRDEAYNETSKEIKLDHISQTVPQNAVVTWSPENPNGSQDWYTIKTAAQIVPANSTTGVPVTTYYRLWKGSAEPADAVAVADTTMVTIPEDGIWTLRVWSETASGVKCEGEYVKTVKVDTTIPDVSVTQVRADLTSQTITFQVSDATSGVSVDQIKVVNGTTTVASQVTAKSDGSGYEGTFTVASAGNYVIHVADIAGNVSESAGYAPMTLKVNAIKDITEHSATISSVTRRGTYAVTAVKYEYKRAGDSAYTEITPYVVKDDNGNLTASYSFQNLAAKTKYQYRITTTSAIGEALSYSGSFKTGGVSGISITGKAIDASDANADITVTLLEGNTVLKTAVIKSGNSFVFDKVADGNYNITATNGITSKTVSVNVYKGKVIDPSGDILLTLRNGMSTSVVIQGAKTPSISVSGLDDIFNYDTVNFTEADKKFIAEGGSVEFRLTANYKAASAISQSTLSSIYKLMKDNEKVNMFVDFTLTKIRTYASGVVESRTQVAELAGGVTLRIIVPLSSKLVKAPKKSLIRVHNGKASLLADLDASANSFTIESNQFSTYALTYKPASKDSQKDHASDNKSDKNKHTSTASKTDQAAKTNSKKSLRDYSASPKTGDGTPLAGAAVILCMAACGIVILKKKKTQA